MQILLSASLVLMPPPMQTIFALENFTEAKLFDTDAKAWPICILLRIYFSSRCWKNNDVVLMEIANRILFIWFKVRKESSCVSMSFLIDMQRLYFQYTIIWINTSVITLLQQQFPFDNAHIDGWRDLRDAQSWCCSCWLKKHDCDQNSCFVHSPLPKPSATTRRESYSHQQKVLSSRQEVGKEPLGKKYSFVVRAFRSQKFIKQSLVNSVSCKQLGLVGKNVILVKVKRLKDCI